MAAVRPPLTWSVDDFEEGTLGRRVAETAEVENFRHQVRAVQAWLQQQARDERAWRLAAESVDTLAYATVEQLDDLGDRLTPLVTEWSAACAADSGSGPTPYDGRCARSRGPSRARRSDHDTHHRPGAARRTSPAGPARPDGARWLAAVGVSWFGDYAWNVALAWTAAHTLSPVLAGVVLGAEMLPQAVLVLLGGVLADRYDPRRLLVAGEVGQAAVLLLGALGWATGLRGAPILLAMAVSFGIASGRRCLRGSRWYGSWSRARTSDGAGVEQISTRAMKLLGAPVGGILVAWGGLTAVMVLDAATFLVIAAVLVLVVRPRYGSPAPPTTAGATPSPTGCAISAPTTPPGSS